MIQSASRNCFLALFFIFCLAIFGCAPKIYNKPLIELEHPHFSEYFIKKVAILPFYLPPEAPDHLSFALQKAFYDSLKERDRWQLVSVLELKQAIEDKLGYPQNGLKDPLEARAIGKQTDSDAVITGEVEDYIIGSLAPSEVKLNLVCWHVKSGEMLWQIKLQTICHSGWAYTSLNEPASNPEELLYENLQAAIKQLAKKKLI